jgi:hypothetical protein
LRPLYGTESGPVIVKELAAVEVAPIEGGSGVEVFDQLNDLLAPEGRNADRHYRLGVELSPGSTPLVTERDTQVRRFNFVLTARYELSELGTGRTLDEGTARSVTSYNIVEAADFASLVAKRGAGSQAAREVSREIVNRLSLYFDRRLP